MYRGYHKNRTLGSWVAVYTSHVIKITIPTLTERRKISKIICVAPRGQLSDLAEVIVTHNWNDKIQCAIYLRPRIPTTILEIFQPPDDSLRE